MQVSGSMKLIGTSVPFVGWARVDAVHRANINTSGVFWYLHRFSNNVCHNISTSKTHRESSIVHKIKGAQKDSS